MIVFIYPPQIKLNMQWVIINYVTLLSF